MKAVMRRAGLALAMLAMAAACKEEESGPPTCAKAMDNVYAQGCTFVDGDGNPISAAQATSSCEGWRSQAQTWGCMTVFDTLVDCLATMAHLDCHACDAVMTSLAECLLDAQDDPCPGYSGTDTGCCYTSDPCAWANDGYCDCDETCSWDTVDCEAAAMCETCITTNCASQVSACSGSMDCTMLIQCLEECPAGDETCASACAASYPGGVADLNALESCISTYCSEWCI